MIKRELSGDEGEALVLEIIGKLSGISMDDAAYVLNSALRRLSTLCYIAGESKKLNPGELLPQ